MTLKAPPVLRLVNLDVPDFAIPGVSTGITMIVENIGECIGRFRFLFRDNYGETWYDDTREVRPGERITISAIRTIPAYDVRLDIRAFYVTPEKTIQQVVESGRIFMSDVLAVADNMVRVRSGAEPLSFISVVVGRDIEVEGARAIPVGRLPLGDIYVVIGDLDRYAGATIRYSTLQYFRTRLSREVVYIRGRTIVRKKTTEEEYGTLAGLLARPIASRILEQYMREWE